MLHNHRRETVSEICRDYFLQPIADAREQDRLVAGKSSELSDHRVDEAIRLEGCQEQFSLGISSMVYRDEGKFRSCLSKS